MKSTGEVMGIDKDFSLAICKKSACCWRQTTKAGTVFISVRDIDKPSIVNLAVDLCDMGFLLVATTGTANSLKKAGLKVEKIKKVREGRPHVVDNMISGQIALVINTTEGAQARKDSFS